MNYTIATLAKLSQVTVRTLRFYDESGLLKPAFIGENGYRYYQEKQLLTLQQILFFRELGFELKQIKEILKQDDFDKIHALQVHKKVLQKEVQRLHALINTINKTVDYLQGKQIMDKQELFHGFSPEQQAQYEEYLVNRFGDKVKHHIAESQKNIKNWTKADWEVSSKEFDSICKQLTIMLKKGFSIHSTEVQDSINKHHEWLKKFWTPNKESYIGLANQYSEPTWQSTFTPYHANLAQFLADAMKIFAERKLS